MIGASLGGASCFVLIFTLFDTLNRLRGVEMRSDIENQLAEPPLDTVGLSADQVLTAMRTIAFLDGALAAAGVVLAVFCFRRHQGARYGFSVIAALLLLTAPVAGLLAFLAAAAAVMLWSEESRAWFAGREPRPRNPAPERSSTGGWPFAPGERHGAQQDRDGSTDTGVVGPDKPADPAADPAGPAGPAGAAPRPPSGDTPQPPPYPGSFGSSQPAPGRTAVEDPVPDTSAQEHPQQGGAYVSPSGSAPTAPTAPTGPTGPPGSSRPGTVTAAVVLTMIGSMLGLGAGVLLMSGLALDPQTIRDAVRQDAEVQQLGWDLDQVIALLWAGAAVLVFWSLAGLMLGVFVMRRQGWARWTLLASAAMTALLSLLAVLSLVSVVPMLMGAVTVGLLLSGSARAWFAGSGGSAGPPVHHTPTPRPGSRPGPW